MQGQSEGGSGDDLELIQLMTGWLPTDVVRLFDGQ